MGIKEIRNKRLDDLYSQFVSVKGLIDHFASDEGLDISVVAAELEQAIKKSNDADLPELGSVDLDTLVFTPWSAEEEGRAELMDWLSDTINDCGHNEHSDFYGWMREDLFPFLLSHGFDVGPNFPLWAPSSEICRNDDAVGQASENIPDCAEDQPLVIRGAIFSSFMMVVREFPKEYPKYEEELPKAKTVEWWINKRKFFRSARHSLVFATMALEHFSIDSRKACNRAASKPN